MIVEEAQLATFLQQYFLPFVRVGAMLMVMPIIGARTVSARVRLALAFLITLLVVPLLPALPKIDLLSLMGVFAIVQEALLGIAAGFLFQLVFQVFVLSGQMIAMKMGLGFAAMNDPTNGVQTTVLSQFFLMLVTLMFVSVNGHLILIHLLVQSFTSIPAGVWVIEPDFFMAVLTMSTWMFAAALTFALPVLTSLLIVNIAFGVMSRAAPQLNIFAVGFPFTLVVGMLLLWLGLNAILPSFENALSFGVERLESLLRLR